MVEDVAALTVDARHYNMTRIAYRRRTFLMPLSTGIPSYVMAEVESSYRGEYEGGANVLTIADCKRNVELEFDLHSARDRKQSLAKIDLLLEVFSEFRTALAAEAKLIDSFNKTPKRPPKKSEQK